MIIDKKKFPILKTLEQNSFNKHWNITTFEGLNDISTFAPAITKLAAKWDMYSKMYRKNITILSEEYYKAMARSFKAFSSIDLSKEIQNCSGCLIFKSEAGVYTSFLYIINDIQNMSIVCLYDCDTVYAMANVTNNKLSFNFTSDEGIKGDASEGQIVRGNINIVLCHLLMEKYAKVETKTCMPKSRNKNTHGESMINDTKLKINIRDCTWFTTICRDEEFVVRGHFRLQPKKNEQGEWIKELIYINEFKKQGYHRQAKIETIKTN